MNRSDPRSESSYMWVLAEPHLLVRFDVSPEGRWRSLGDMLLLGPVDAARLRAVNLIRLTFILAALTPLPKWPGTDPPTLSDIRATPNIDSAISLWRGEVEPFSPTGLDWTESDLGEVYRLYEGWSRGRPRDDEANRFLVRMFHLAPERSADESDQLVALGLQIVLPACSRPVSVVANSRNISENNARQVIHRLRNKGYLPASVKRRSEL